MARSKPPSPRLRRARLSAAIRPNVRASAPPPASSFELPILTNANDESVPAQRSGAAPPPLDVRSPLDDQSTGSLPTTRSTTQTTSSSAKLDDQRRLSTILTPSSSEASQSGHDVSTTHTTSNIVGLARRTAHRRPSRASEQILPNIDESLAFQGRWVPLQTDAIQDVEFVNTKPAPEQPEGSGDSPWSGLNRTLGNQNGSSTSPTGSDPNRGGRRGGLGKEKAAKVGGMRHTRACLRCFVYRIECDGQNPCSQCRRRMRTWNLGCTRRRLPERLAYLLPDILTAHLTRERVISYMDTNAESWLGPPFHLPLTQSLGEDRPLFVPVREVVPLGSKIVERPAFSSGIDSQGERTVQEINLRSPPLVPYFGSDGSTRTEVEVDETIKQWLRRIIESKRSNWQRIIFPSEHRAWERNIMGQICSLIDASNNEHKHLEIAMELTFFNHIQIHPFEIPSAQVDNVYSKLQNPEFNQHRPGPEERVCPRAVNTFLTMLIMRKVQLQAEALLEHLSILFADRKSTVETGIFAFCESFLLLLVLGQLQISVFQTGQWLHNDDDERYTKEEAQQEIREMEAELATIIIELCVFKLRKVAKRMKSEGFTADGEVDMLDQESPSRFFDRLHRITELCGGSSAWETELGIIDERTFGDTNTQRILQRLYKAVSQVLPPAVECHVELDPSTSGK